MMVNHFPSPIGQGHLVLPQEVMASRRRIEAQGRQENLEDIVQRETVHLVHPGMVHPVRLEMVLPVNASSPPLLGSILKQTRTGIVPELPQVARPTKLQVSATTSLRH